MSTVHQIWNRNYAKSKKIKLFFVEMYKGIRVEMCTYSKSLAYRMRRLSGICAYTYRGLLLSPDFTLTKLVQSTNTCQVAQTLKTVCKHCVRAKQECAACALQSHRPLLLGGSMGCEHKLLRFAMVAGAVVS